MKTKFYTGAGDKGSTMLGQCSFNKDEPLFDVLGTLDELNSWIGFTRSNADVMQNRQGLSRTLKSIYTYIAKSLLNMQQNLFIAQAEIANLGMNLGVKNEKSKVKSLNSKKIQITRKHTKKIETELMAIDKKVPQLKNFIIPGGVELATRIEVARAISRRLERVVVTLSREMKLNKHLLQYLNRLSSILFALARLVNHIENVKYEHPKY